MKGVMLDRKSIDNGDIDLTALEAVVPGWTYFDSTTEHEVLPRISDADVIVSNKVKLTKTAIESLRATKLICIAATGTNNVDLDAAAACGIPVANVTGYATPSVVQHVYSLILALATRFKEYQAAIHDGYWQQSAYFCLLDYPVHELAGKTLGIIGYGELGKAVAQVGKAFGMTILISSRKGKTPTAGRVSLERLLKQSDVVSLHCPLTPQTRDLIGERELQAMKPTALLINTARGGVVNEQALADALQRGVIAGAGVDVLTEEPPVHGNPLLNVSLPNLIVTPHIAWASVESRQRVINEVALNISAFLKGEKRNCC